MKFENYKSQKDNLVNGINEENKEDMIYFYAMNRYGDVGFFDKCKDMREFTKLKEIYWNKDDSLTLHIISKEDYVKQINNKEWTQDSFKKDLGLEFIEEGEE